MPRRLGSQRQRLEVWFFTVFRKGKCNTLQNLTHYSTHKRNSEQVQYRVKTCIMCTFLMLTLYFLFKTRFSTKFLQKTDLTQKSAPPTWGEYLSLTFSDSFEWIWASPNLGQIKDLEKKCYIFAEFLSFENQLFEPELSQSFEFGSKKCSTRLRWISVAHLFRQFWVNLGFT